MGKKARYQPVIQSVQHQQRENRDEHPLCKTPGCKNVVARWTNKRTCSRCRS